MFQGSEISKLISKVEGFHHAAPYDLHDNFGFSD
jgi:hypothetical protein